MMAEKIGSGPAWSGWLISCFIHESGDDHNVIMQIEYILYWRQYGAYARTRKSAVNSCFIVSHILAQAQNINLVKLSSSSEEEEP